MTQVKHIYLDYAATCPVDPKVIETMIPYQSTGYGNTMSIHSWGRQADQAVQTARIQIAKSIKAKPSEIIFTSSATESNNMALKGWANLYPHKKHIIVSSIEHKSVLETVKYLKTQGYQITYLKVDQYGLVNLDQLKNEIKKNTLLVSIMHANNEVGTIQDIKKIGHICRQKEVVFHTDAAQSFTKLNINVNKMKIDLLTLSSHKIYGPKGVGVLYKRHGLIGPQPLLHGGGQEKNLRSSTVNTSAIVGMAKAVKITMASRLTEQKNSKKLKDRFIKNILENIDGVTTNGHLKKSLVNGVNLSFENIEGESILLSLDNLGIQVSTGSACSSDDLKPSYVLLAMGKSTQTAHSSIRFSWGRLTTTKDIDYTVESLTKIIKKLRILSPLT